MNTPTQPLPSLTTMIEICSEVRDGLRREIGRNPDFRGEHWFQDREPCLYALDAGGERLNEGSWCRWQRRKSDVEALLQDYPEAAEIIVDSGVNVAANKDDLEHGNYTPVFWQAVIWKRDEPVYSQAQLEDLLQRRSGFRSFDEMFDRTRSGYRPSVDVRDPEMLAIGNHYDKLAAYRSDERRAYRYGDTPAVKGAVHEETPATAEGPRP